MWAIIWLAMFGLAVGATATWALLERRIPLATTTGMGAWGWLAYRSEQIEVVSGGVVIVREGQWLQLFALFMAVITAIGLLLWFFGDFPPEEDDAQIEAESPVS